MSSQGMQSAQQGAPHQEEAGTRSLMCM